MVPENVHTPSTEGIGNSWGWEGSQRPKTLRSSRGVGGLRKNPFCGEVWIIYGTTHCDFVFVCGMLQEQVALGAHHLHFDKGNFTKPIK